MPGADLVLWAHQLGQNALAEFGGPKQSINDERKIRGEPVGALDEPLEALQPWLPLTGLHPLGRARARDFLLRIDKPRDLLDGFRRRGHAGAKRGARPQQDQGDVAHRERGTAARALHGLSVQGHGESRVSPSGLFTGTSSRSATNLSRDAEHALISANLPARLTAPTRATVDNSHCR